MKIYAQHGAQAGEKMIEGFQRRLLDGVVFSPRDISQENLRSQLTQIRQNHPKADLLFDPQYYTCLTATDQGRLGYLPDDYIDYFASRRRLDLSREAQIQQDIDSVFQFQVGLQVTHLIAPNILISRSFDSREAAIAIDFLSIADRRYKELGDKRPLLLTVAISREALLDRTALAEFITEITGLGSTASGYYLLIAVKSTEARSEVFHSDVIAGWLFLNYALHINGYTVVNGYSDLLMPLLGTVGASAGATGWWSNLRAFSLDRFGAGPGGGRLPIQRYLSIALLNRITFSELDMLRRFMPKIMNKLPSDELYDPEGGSQPQRNQEVLQSWDALRHLNSKIERGEVEDRLARYKKIVQQAMDNYQEAQQYIAFDQKSNDEHLSAINEGINLFKELAELESPSE